MKNENTFKKGRKKTGGRMPGSANRISPNSRYVISDFLNEVATKEKMVDLFNILKPVEQAHFLTKMFAFVTPKMESHEINQEMTAEDAREILNKILEERSNNETN